LALRHANAGTYRIDPDGVVQSKYFAKDFTERYFPPTILLREFGAPTGTSEMAVETDHLDLKTYAFEDALRPNLHFTLVLDVKPKPGMHVYAPGVEHYTPSVLRSTDRHTTLSAQQNIRSRKS